MKGAALILPLGILILSVVTMTTGAMALESADVRISARSVGDEKPSVDAVAHVGSSLGVAGAQAGAPAIKGELGYDPVAEDSERLIFHILPSQQRAVIELEYFYPNEVVVSGRAYHEAGMWRAWESGDPVGQGLFVANDADTGTAFVFLETDRPFNTLELSATPYVDHLGSFLAEGVIVDDSSDYLVRAIRLESGEYIDGVTAADQ